MIFYDVLFICHSCLTVEICFFRQLARNSPLANRHGFVASAFMIFPIKGFISFILQIPKNPPALDNMESTGPRWKGKNFSCFARDHPMSGLVKQLQESFRQERVTGQFSGCNVLLPLRPELSDLLDRACFGRQISTSDRDLWWFQLAPEEAFYLVHALSCLKISGAGGGQLMDEEQLWKHMSSSRETFPDLYMAYAHLRSKNWVVRSGIQYGVDFVAYRHHPALVHSEYAVLVLGEAASSGGESLRPRLREWADLQGTLRVCGSVAKALLVITIKRNDPPGVPFLPRCMEQSFIEERVMTRWIPQQQRDSSPQVLSSHVAAD